MESIRPRVAVPKEDAFAMFDSAPALDVTELRVDLDEVVGQVPGDPCEAPGRDSGRTDSLA